MTIFSCQKNTSESEKSTQTDTTKIKNFIERMKFLKSNPANERTASNSYTVQEANDLIEEAFNFSYGFPNIYKNEFQDSSISITVSCTNGILTESELSNLYNLAYSHIANHMSSINSQDKIGVVYDSDNEYYEWSIPKLTYGDRYIVSGRNVIIPTP
ncbi:MAG TPA: hypothetical protein PLH86_07515 [Saprospiraceae bacterium]|nr:hypothetical protein [Saprospiraceae bacterium]